MSTTRNTPEGSYKNRETPQPRAAEQQRVILPKEYVKAINSVIPPDRGFTYNPPPREKLPRPLLPIPHGNITTSPWENGNLAYLIITYFGLENYFALFQLYQDLVQLYQDLDISNILNSLNIHSDTFDAVQIPPGISPATINLVLFPRLVEKTIRGQFKSNWNSHLSPVDIMYYLWYGMGLEFTPEVEILFKILRQHVQLSQADEEWLKHKLQHEILRIIHNSAYRGAELNKLGFTIALFSKQGRQ